MGPTQKTKKDKESGTGINAESPSFQESRREAAATRTDWSFSTHRAKRAKQEASPAGVDSHGLELRLCFSKSPRWFYHSGQASDDHLH